MFLLAGSMSHGAMSVYHTLPYCNLYMKMDALKVMMLMCNDDTMSFRAIAERYHIHTIVRQQSR